jgi:rubrerythrin
MSDASTTTSPAEIPTPPIQQVLDAMEAAELTPEDALQLSLVLLNFVEEVHLDNLEELLEQEQSDGVSIAVWAADSARLKTARELLEEVLGDDDDDEEAIDGLADDGEGDQG